MRAALVAVCMVACGVGDEIDETWECRIVVGHAEGPKWAEVDTCGLPDPHEIEVFLRRCDAETGEVCQVYCEPTLRPCVGPDRNGNAPADGTGAQEASLCTPAITRSSLSISAISVSRGSHPEAASSAK
jgi:hypothetical protein